jgi:hypothetical protein
MANGYQ